MCGEVGELQIVILAGGKATRLYPLTKRIAKSMVMIYGKPFLEHQIELLKRNKIDEIVLCVGTFSDQIMEYFGDGKKFGISIKYSIEKQDMLFGTAGALKNAENLLDRFFFVMYGDSYLPVDFHEILSYFEKSGKMGLMSVYKNDDKYDKSNVAIKNGMIEIYDKSGKNEDLSYIDYGLLVLKKETIDLLPKHKFVNLDFLLNKLIEKKELVAYKVTERFYEIGSFNGINDFENYIKSKN